MAQQPQGAPGYDDDLRSFLEYLRGRGDRISEHFAHGVADQIDVEDLQEIVDAINEKLEGIKRTNRSLGRRLEDIQDHCLSAKKYLGKENYTPFMKLLRSIAQQLKSL